jgi:hypothetical protein
VISATTLIIERASPVHWEAVLVTAVPALFAMIGVLGLGYMQWVMHGKANNIEAKATSIDKAVNGTPEGVPTLREKVQAIDEAVNGAAPGDPSVRQNVEELVGRRDLAESVQGLVERRDLDPELET